MKKQRIFFRIVIWISLLISCNNSQPKTIPIDYKKAEDLIKESEKQWAESVASVIPQ